MIYAEDILFHNDISRWRKFTNSLRMQLLLRISNRSETNPFQKLSTMIAIDGSLKNIKERLLAMDTKLWNTNKIVEFRNIEANALISFDEKFQLIGKTSLGELFTFKKGMQPYKVGKGIRCKPEN